jgi:hypothetical protein
MYLKDKIEVKYKCSGNQQYIYVYFVVYAYVYRVIHIR